MAAVPFATTFTNPNTNPVTITSLTVSLGTVPAGCQAGWFTIGQSNVSVAHPITVPANGSVTLPDPSTPRCDRADRDDERQRRPDRLPGRHLRSATAAPSPAASRSGSPPPSQSRSAPPAVARCAHHASTDPNRVDTVPVTVTTTRRRRVPAPTRVRDPLVGRRPWRSSGLHRRRLLDRRPSTPGASHTVIYNDHIAPGGPRHTPSPSR